MDDKGQKLFVLTRLLVSPPPPLLSKIYVRHWLCAPMEHWGLLYKLIIFLPPYQIRGSFQGTFFHAEKTSRLWGNIGKPDPPVQLWYMRFWCYLIEHLLKRMCANFLKKLRSSFFHEFLKFYSKELVFELSEYFRKPSFFYIWCIINTYNFLRITKMKSIHFYDP